MTRLCIAVLLLGLILAAGCQKKSIKGPGGAAAVTESSTRQDMAEHMPRISAEKQKAAEAKQSEIPEEQRTAIRDELVRQAPTFDIVYDPAKQVFTGKALPVDGLPLANAVTWIHDIAKLHGDLSDKKFIADTVHQFLDTMAGQANVPGADPNLTPAQQKEQTASKEQTDQVLVPVADPVGDWRSLREVREGETKLLVEHTDQFYKILLVPYGKKVITLQEYKDGEQTSVMNLGYTGYNATTGEMTTVTATGSPGPVYEFKQKAAEPDNIYLKAKDQFIYTVYKKVGTGGKPVTKEQIAKELEILSPNKPRNAPKAGK